GKIVLQEFGVPTSAAPRFEQVSARRGLVFLDEQFDPLGLLVVVLPRIDQVIIARQVLENKLIFRCHRCLPRVPAHPLGEAATAVASSPSRTSAAASAPAAERPDVNTIRADDCGAPSGFGPISSTTRRAIAGAGSMNVTGQGDSRSSRSRHSGKCVQRSTNVVGG